MDARLVASLVTGPADDPLDVEPGDWLVAACPVRLPDGRVLAYHPPRPVAFNLIESKRHRDRGARRRHAVVGNLAAPDENYTDGMQGRLDELCDWEPQND